MQTWLATPEFSQYRSNQLIITGESYGGHYVPSITARIVEQNLNNPQEPKINIGGFLVGNAWTDAFYDNSGAVEMWYWHGMISNETRNGILNTCNMSDVGPLARESKALASSILTEVHHGTSHDSEDPCGIQWYRVTSTYTYTMLVPRGIGRCLQPRVRHQLSLFLGNL